METQAMLQKLKIAGQAGKAVSYVMLGLNHTARFTNKVVTSVGNGIRDQGLYKIELITKDGEVSHTLTNQSHKSIKEILNQMNTFGVHAVHITSEN